jgi:two-component system, chemotaxis family, sensor kinase CheA
MEGLKKIFAGEAQEILQNLEPDIIKLEEGDDPEVIHRIFRYVHTLKGSSGMAGFNDISLFTHRLENLMDCVRSKKFGVTDKLIDILLKSLDWIRMSIFGASPDVDLKESSLKLLSAIDQIMGVCEEKKKEKENTQAEEIILENEDNYNLFRVQAKFKESVFENGLDPLVFFEELSVKYHIIEKKVDYARLPEFSDLDPEKCYLTWDLTVRTHEKKEKIEEIFLFLKDNNEIIIEEIRNISEPVRGGSENKIGEIMLKKRIITEKQLKEALEVQEEKNEKIAEIIVKKGFASLSDVQFALDEQEKLKKKMESSTVRVATEKLDVLMNLLGEIVIGQSAIARAADELGAEQGRGVRNALHGLDRTTREFQEHIMGIRMIQIRPLFEQFKRFIRDTSRDYGKEIRLIIEGAETELDKTVIEKMNDPLKHMIRNCIDHGIEMPEDRLRAGKDARGMIRLKAYHQEGNVFIEVTDDGRGIKKEALRKKAVSMGLMNQYEEVSDDRLYSFMFLPGFSTAEKVGQLSGRGVGMDVVKTNIESLRGIVKVESEEGKGARIIIKLPLTLAIIDGMLVRVGRDRYIIPLLSIIESIRPDKSAVKKVEDKGELIFVRGQYIPLLRMYNLFDVKDVKFKNPWESIVVITESNGLNVALMVDELIGQQQIVIKSIDNDLTKNRAIAGASLLGDGTVSLIIDIHGLVNEVAAA